MVGCVGTDLFSDLVTGGLRDAGVHIDHVRSVPGPTGIAHIRVDDSGENDIVMVPLANCGSQRRTRSTTAFASVGRTLPGPPHPARDPLGAHAATPSARPSEAGLTVVLDPAPAAALDDEHLAARRHRDAERDRSVASSPASRSPTRHPPSKPAAGSPTAGRQRPSSPWPSAGAVLVTAEASSDSHSIPVDAVDTTAAGDAFAGYLGASLADGYDITDAIERAIAAGALTVTTRGALPRASPTATMSMPSPPRRKPPSDETARTRRSTRSCRASSQRPGTPTSSSSPTPGCRSRPGPSG